MGNEETVVEFSGQLASQADSKWDKFCHSLKLVLRARVNFTLSASYLFSSNERFEGAVKLRRYREKERLLL